MARVNNLSNFLTDVASAIKTKKGSETNIPAANFDTEILALPSQGTYEQRVLNISANGTQTITPSSGYDAIDELELTVAVPEKQLQSKTYDFTQNTNIQLLPDTGYDGFDMVTLNINVPSSQVNNQDKIITENGIYTADSGYTGLGEVTVNIPTTSDGIKRFASMAAMEIASAEIDDEAIVYNTNDGMLGYFKYANYSGINLPKKSGCVVDISVPSVEYTSTSTDTSIAVNLITPIINKIISEQSLQTADLSSVWSTPTPTAATSVEVTSIGGVIYALVITADTVLHSPWAGDTAIGKLCFPVRPIYNNQITTSVGFIIPEVSEYSPYYMCSNEQLKIYALDLAASTYTLNQTVNLENLISGTDGATNILGTDLIVTINSDGTANYTNLSGGLSTIDYTSSGSVQPIVGWTLYANSFHLDTSDATAVASDIAYGKTAYRNDTKITGTAELYNKTTHIKRFETEQAMQADPTATKGDLAAVYGEGFVPYPNILEYKDERAAQYGEITMPDMYAFPTVYIKDFPAEEFYSRC